MRVNKSNFLSITIWFLIEVCKDYFSRESNVSSGPVLRPVLAFTSEQITSEKQVKMIMNRDVYLDRITLIDLILCLFVSGKFLV